MYIYYMYVYIYIYIERERERDVCMYRVHGKGPLTNNKQATMLGHSKA